LLCFRPKSSVALVPPQLLLFHSSRDLFPFRLFPFRFLCFFCVCWCRGTTVLSAKNTPVEIGKW
jgi:hypothetical protein